MKKIVSILAVACVALGTTSCDDLFEPAQENNQSFDYMYQNPNFAEGILGNAYTRIPIGSYPFSEVATDDAVSNDDGNSWRKMAAGSWTSDNNPADRWQTCRAALQYINLFLANAEKVAWNGVPHISQMFCDRDMGEAYGMRAMYMYYLLEAHAGYSEDGELLGVPIVLEPEDQGSNFNIPRNTFAECVEQIKADAAMALELLPLKYGDESELQRLKNKYTEASEQEVERVFGIRFIGRMDGHIVEAFLAKLDLLAASPRFAAGSGISYETAAKSFATVLNRIGGLNGFDQSGNTWYTNVADIEKLEMANLPKEILWCGERGKNSDLEKDNFPPTLYGNGRINPSQNLVDAFPTFDGYPIKDQASKYNPQDPYSQRDPRLAKYILYNGARAGDANSIIYTAADGTTNDALNMVIGRSTRTGYYMFKLMRQDCNLDPTYDTKQNHYTARIRYTEMFLSYAEAANEAGGPDYKAPGATYSAYDIIKAIRKRAGIGMGLSDPYLESIKGDKDKMRELIRNERRIELCFEGHRFWDLRRWNLDLNEPIRGMRITTTNNVTTYEDFTLSDEPRSYRDYMYYGPIPYSEVLKYSALQQNKGW